MPAGVEEDNGYYAECLPTSLSAEDDIVDEHDPHCEAKTL